jgi:hypothetical protein
MSAPRRPKARNDTRLRTKTVSVSVGGRPLVRCASASPTSCVSGRCASRRLLPNDRFHAFFRSMPRSRNCTMSPARKPKRASRRRVARSRFSTAEVRVAVGDLAFDIVGGQVAWQRRQRRWARTGMGPSKPPAHRPSAIRNRRRSQAPLCASVRPPSARAAPLQHETPQAARTTRLADRRLV